MHYKPATKEQINKLLYALLESKGEFFQPADMPQITEKKRVDYNKPLKDHWKECATAELKKAFNIQ